MLGVKIILLLFVISFVWHIITNAMSKTLDPETKLKMTHSSYSPWWYLLDGLLILIDLFGLIYIAAYFLFVFIK